MCNLSVGAGLFVSRNDLCSFVGASFQEAGGEVAA